MLDAAQAYVGGEVTASGRTRVPLPEVQEEVFDLSALEALAAQGMYKTVFVTFRFADGTVVPESLLSMFSVPKDPTDPSKLYAGVTASSAGDWEDEEEFEGSMQSGPAPFQVGHACRGR